MGYTYIEILLAVYLKIKFNWTFCIFFPLAALESPKCRFRVCNRLGAPEKLNWAVLLPSDEVS